MAYPISDVARRIIYSGSAGVGPYSFAFEVLEQTDIAVYKNTTLLTLTTDYSVSINVDGTGSVTLVSPAVAADDITLIGARAIERTSDFVTGGDLFANTLNDELDSQTIFAQQQQDEINRSMKMAPWTNTAFNTQLPDPQPNKFLAFNATADGFQSTSGSELANLVAYANAFADTFVGDGSTTSWTLTRTPASLLNLDVSIDGVTQVPTTNYTTSGTTFTMTSAPPSGSVILVRYAEVLADSNGDSANVRYTPAGTGAVDTTVQAKLRETVSRSDYDSDINFNAAKGNKPNIDGSDNFDAKVTPAGENAQVNLSEAMLTVATSNRSAIRYRTSTEVSITCPRHILMSGFRFFGQYTKARAPVFSRTLGGQQAVSLSTDLGAESTAHLDGWYAVFACANDGDSSPVFRIMPCLRVGSVLGSQVTLCSAAEAIHTNTATTYGWTSTDNLNGVECLVINETVDGRSNAFSGRVTTITANTSTTVTLDDIGSIATLDWLLPAPPGFDHYCYQGMFYYDTPGDVRNISDSGSLVKAKMLNTADPNWSATGQVGSVVAPVAIRFGGYISPLATAVVVKDTASFSTGSTGSYASYFDTDGSQHIVQTFFATKEAAATETQLMDGITVPFCFRQEFYYSNTGTIIALRSGGTLEITGWIEN